MKLRALFWALLLGSVLAVKLLLAWRFPGFLTGDDLEVLQTAARYAWGLDYEPWDLRCLFHPLTFVWPLLKLAHAFGLRDPAVLTWIGTIPTAVISTAGAYLLHSLARARGFSEAASRAAAFFYAFHWLPLGYGATHFPRPVSAVLLVGAFLLVSRRERTVWMDAAAGVLAAAAFAVRWSEGAVLLVLLADVWWRSRDLRRVASVCAGFALGAVLFVGLFDLATWGGPFASLREYLRLLAAGAPPASPSTDQPLVWYFTTPLRWAGPLALLLAALGWRDPRGRRAILLFGAIVLLFSLFRFKAWRYLQAAVPFLALAAAAGWERLREKSRAGRWLAAAAIVLTVPVGLERALTLLRDKSQSAILAARHIAAELPDARVVALEQDWAFGGRLYLGNGPEIRDIPVSRPLSPAAVRTMAAGADAVAIYSKDSSPEVRGVLEELSFRESARFKRDASREVVVYFAERARSRAF
ncbi:MAG: hypothetical protein ABR576_05005 [Thermoanaerobaculia bacterium]